MRCISTACLSDSDWPLRRADAPAGADGRGMLDLPVAKFIPPNIIGCLLWPPLYFLPGILAGAAIDIPADENSASFKWLLLGAALLAWLAAWLCWRLWRSAKSAGDRLTRFLPRSRRCGSLRSRCAPPARRWCLPSVIR